MTDKFYIGAEDLLADSFRLAQLVHQSGYEPTFIMALWRGGAPIGLAVQEYFAYRNIETDHILVRTSSYHGIDQQSRSVIIHGLSYLVKNLSAEDRVLIVDDVFDTGQTIDAIIETMEAQLKLNFPQDIRVAVPYFKPTRNKTDRLPEYFLHETDEWLIYPHSVEGLTPEEIQTHKPDLYEVLNRHL